MKVIPGIITFKVSEIRVYPREEGEMFPGEPIDLIIDPPFDRVGLDRLLRSREIEIEDGKLVGLKVLTIFEENEELIYEHWYIENGSWTLDYFTPENCIS